MRIGGHIDAADQKLTAWLHSASSGPTQFFEDRWWVSCWDWWVVDVTRSSQFQRIEGGRKFLRPPGLVALYRPRLRFEEWQDAGRTLHESWVLFGAYGEMKEALLALTNPCGYCHFEDPDKIVARGLLGISEALFYRRVGFAWHAQSAFLGLLAHLVSSQAIGRARRLVGATKSQASASGIVEETENYIRSRIGCPVGVQELAARCGQSLSTFAHRYKVLAGETPYRTIVRLKMEEAKLRLLQSGLSVKETSAGLGFSSEFHFSRCFKRVVGLSPALYVRAMNIKSSP